MAKNYKALIEEQRIRIREEGAFGVATEDITLLVPEERRDAWGKAPKNLRPTHPRLMFTEAEIPGIRAALEDDTPTNRLFKEYLAEETDGILPPAPDFDANVDEKDEYLAFLAMRRKSAHNYQPKPIEQCAIKALGYKLYEKEDYGYEAIYSLKNYLYTMDFKSLPGDQYRAFGYVLFLTACVYDWCYELLDAEDKEQIIAAAENKICKGENMRGVRFEMRFPPYLQSSVCGHGSEFPLLRDHLAFAIAIYDENPSWWNYTGARFFNDFLPFRNEYYKSGIAAQGTGYAPLRCVADFFSAWIIKYAVGYNPYIGIDRVARSFFGYEYGGEHILRWRQPLPAGSLEVPRPRLYRGVPHGRRGTSGAGRAYPRRRRHQGVLSGTSHDLLRYNARHGSQAREEPLRRYGADTVQRLAPRSVRGQG